MIDKQIDRSEPAATSTDLIAAMRTEIPQLRQVVQAAKAAGTHHRPQGLPCGRWVRNPGLSGETPGESL